MSGIGATGVSLIKVYPEREWLYRLLGVCVGVLILGTLALIAMTVSEDLIKKQFDNMMSSFYRTTAKMGIVVEDVIVEGNVRTSYEDLLQAIELSENESILGVDIAKIKQKIEQLTWVKSCRVERSFFPHNLLIKVTERQVKAIWEYEGRQYPVDMDGNVIEVEDFELNEPILFISGEEAPQHLKELLDVVYLDEELSNRLKAAVFVSGRRWNLVFDYLDNGIVVKLPEENYALAYQKISLLNKRNGIFKRKLTSFDVRYPNRVVVDIDKSVYDLIFNK